MSSFEGIGGGSKLEMGRFWLEGKCLVLNLYVVVANSRWVDFPLTGKLEIGKEFLFFSIAETAHGFEFVFRQGSVNFVKFH